jgi:hypothetical protein
MARLGGVVGNWLARPREDAGDCCGGLVICQPARRMGRNLWSKRELNHASKGYNM